MNEEIKEKSQTLSPFTKLCMTIGQLPASYVESMSYYEQLIWFTKYLQDQVIPTVNQNAEAVEELQGLFIELQEYVNNYFDNLDVQEEINHKLDEMASDGTLTNLIKNYIDPIQYAFEQDVRGQLNTMENKVDALSNGSPKGVYATKSALEADNPNHDYIYLVTADGKWYYYSENDSAWVIGGTYQGTSLNLSDPEVLNLLTGLQFNLVDMTPTEEGKSINTTGTSVDFTNPIIISGSSYYLFDAIENDVFSISGKGGSNAYLYTFIDSSNNILSTSGRLQSGINLIAIAPSGTSKLLINKVSGSDLRILKGYYSANMKDLESGLKYKANAGISKNELISPSSSNVGIWNPTGSPSSSETSNYFTYNNVKGGEYYYITGRSGASATTYPLISFYDNNDTLISFYGTTNSHTYTDELIKIPINCTKFIVNRYGSSGSYNESVYDTSIFNKTLKEVYDEQSMPDYVIGSLSSKQLGVFSKPYVCFTADDGHNSLITNTIPNIIEAVYNDTGEKIPFTFCLYSTSPIFSNASYVETLKNTITEYGCGVAQHGPTSFESYTKDELLNFLTNEKTFFDNLNIEVRGLSYPYHDNNEMIRAICGGLYGACCYGGTSSSITRAYGSPRQNMYKIFRISAFSKTEQEMKNMIDIAYDNNYLICFFIHDDSFVDTDQKNKLINVIKYCITKEMTFCNIGDIPELY